MAVDVVIDKSPQNQIDISTNGSIMTPTITPAQQVKNGYIQGQPLRGYIAALKDAFGFIEAANLDKEIFFHFRYVHPFLYISIFIKKCRGFKVR